MKKIISMQVMGLAAAAALTAGCATTPPVMESQLTHEWVAESRAAAVNFEGNNQACVEKAQSLAGYEQCMQARGYALAQQGEDLRFFTSALPPL
jgi:uncharacterized lipoprotein YajG